mgnify:CR=1 FL=1
MPGYPNNTSRQGGVGRRQSVPDPRGGHQENLLELPKPQKISYFKDPKSKVLDPELLDTQAIKWAKAFAELKTSQMRRFYDDLKAIERKILAGNGPQEQAVNFEKAWPMVVIFKAKAAYAEKRNFAPRAFTQFIFDHVSSIQDLSDFQSFLKVFEAVVAFHKYFSKEKN